MCIKRWKPIQAVLHLACMFYAINSHAQIAGTNINIEATLVAGGCTVSIASKKLLVEMGEWTTEQISANAQGSVPVLFAINLENCSSTKGVTVTFNGQADSSDPSLLAIGGAGAAKNVGIAILDKDRRRIPLGKPSDVYNVYPGAEFVRLNFYSHYVASGEVSAGVANAAASFSIEYP